MSQQKNYVVVAYQGKVATIPSELIPEFGQATHDDYSNDVIITTLRRFKEVTQNILKQPLPDPCKIIGTYNLWFTDAKNSPDESDAPE